MQPKCHHIVIVIIIVIANSYKQKHIYISSMPSSRCFSNLRQFACLLEGFENSVILTLCVSTVLLRYAFTFVENIFDVSGFFYFLFRGARIAKQLLLLQKLDNYCRIMFYNFCFQQFVFKL